MTNRSGGGVAWIDEGLLILGASRDQFSLPLCKAIVSSNAGKTLAQIQKSNLFITAVGSWYQYHPLFREFLQTQLHNNYPEGAEDLHRRASDWFEENGMIVEAIHVHRGGVERNAVAKHLFVKTCAIVWFGIAVDQVGVQH